MQQLHALLQLLLKDAIQTQARISKTQRRIAESMLVNAQTNQRLIELLRDQLASQQPVKAKATIEPFLIRQMPQSQLN